MVADDALGAVTKLHSHEDSVQHGSRRGLLVPRQRPEESLSDRNTGPFLVSLLQTAFTIPATVLRTGTRAHMVGVTCIFASTGRSTRIGIFSVIVLRGMEEVSNTRNNIPALR